MKANRVPIYELRKVRTASIVAEDATPYQAVEGEHLRASSDAVRAMRTLVDGSGVEQVWILALDARRKIIGAQLVSQGSVTQSLAHPREVFRLAITLGAAAVVVGHNHPSGDPSPSADDHALTRRLRESAEILGIPLVDHLVIGEGRHHSYAENNWSDL